MTFIADYRPLPPPLDQTKSAVFIAAQNFSGDLFLFYKKQVSGLEARGLYDVTFAVEIATHVPHGCGGAGGQPGEGVYVKVGASSQEPERVLIGDEYVMNIDKGNQSKSGSQAVVIGNIANSIPCQPAPGGDILNIWELKALASASRAVRVRANPDGSAWLIVGTDAAAESPIRLYYTKFSGTFERVE